MSGTRVEFAAALALTALLVALGVTLGSGGTQGGDSRVSAFVDGPRGLHALHLVLDGVGAAPRRRMSAPKASDPTDATLVVAQPSEPITRRETSHLVEWVSAGGRLVVVAGPAPPGAFAPFEKPLLDTFGVSVVPITRIAGDDLLVCDPALADGLGRIDWPAGRAVVAANLSRRAGEFEAVVTAGARCVVGRVPFGDEGGELVVISDAGFLDNESLSRADNAVLAARLVMGRAAVEFDEFHHGFEEAGGANDLAGVLAAMLVGTWPGRALLVAALAGALYLAGASVRLGAPECERPPPRRALSEHAEALGRIFESARARRETLAILAAGARRMTGPRAGIRATLPAGEFVRRLRLSVAPGAAELADAMERAAGTRAAKDVEMATAAANLAAAKRRFLHGG